MRIFERIHKLSTTLMFRECTIRVWASSRNLRKPLEDAEQKEAIWNVYHRMVMVKPAPNTSAVVSFAEAISELPFCNAVEVIIGEEGVLIYPDWP